MRAEGALIETKRFAPPVPEPEGFFFAPFRPGGEAGSKENMNTHGARYRQDPGGPTPPFDEPPPPPPVHDLLVMSLGPEARPDDRANHACLNSLTSRSWIMAAGAREKTSPG